MDSRDCGTARAVRTMSPRGTSIMKIQSPRHRYCVPQDVSLVMTGNTRVLTESKISPYTLNYFVNYGRVRQLA